MKPDTPSDPPRRFLNIGPSRVAYTDEGSGPGTIVAVPGLPGSVRDFRWLAAAFGDRVRFLRLDLPGYGESDRVGYTGMTIPQRAEIVEDLIDSLGLGPVALLGHSSGASVAAHLARRRPESVSTCILVAPSGPTQPYPVALYSGLARLLATRPGRAVMGPVLEVLFRAIGFPGYLTANERMYSSLDAATKDFTLYRRDIVEMTQPTLIAWARDDPMIPVSRYEALEAMASPGPRLHFDDGGHSIQKTHATELADAILNHIT